MVDYEFQVYYLLHLIISLAKFQGTILNNLFVVSFPLDRFYGTVRTSHNITDKTPRELHSVIICICSFIPWGLPPWIKAYAVFTAPYKLKFEQGESPALYGAVIQHMSRPVAMPSPPLGVGHRKYSFD